MSAKKNVSACRTYLRAFNYLRTSEFFLKPSDNRKLLSYLKARDAFLKAISVFHKKQKQVEVPFEGSFLPGYLFLPDGVKNPPLMIMFGGLDSLAEELYFGPCQHLNERSPRHSICMTGYRRRCMHLILLLLRCKKKWKKHTEKIKKHLL